MPAPRPEIADLLKVDIPPGSKVMTISDLHLPPDRTDVSTETATVRVPIKLLPDLMPGTVALPHGWGHQAATGLSVASKTRGVNVNLPPSRKSAR